jgi:NAD(P)-dependent dehydrogenase (short-subunit alcohol dehydrogenase family)
MPAIVLTGSNRGIGLELSRQLSTSFPSTGHVTIFAGVRGLNGDIGDLQSLASSTSDKVTIKIVECNLSSTSSIKSFASKIIESLGNDKVDLLINNAGINAVPDQTSLTIGEGDLQEHMMVNVMGPATLTSALSSHLAPNGVVVNLTSGLGSCGKAVIKCTTYSISKAAVNMLTVHQASDLGDKKVRVICMDPGWVKTRMGGEGAIITAEESVSGILKVVNSVKDKKDGGELGKAKFFQYDGEEVPW